MDVWAQIRADWQPDGKVYQNVVKGLKVTVNTTFETIYTMVELALGPDAFDLDVLATARAVRDKRNKLRK